MTTAPTDRASAEQYVHATLALPSDLIPQLRWDDLMADLYRAADQTWNVDLIDHDEWWVIVWANRVHATNDDRAALVRFTMSAAREDMGADEDYVRESMRDQWERRRAEHRTYAVPFDSEHITKAMPPADYYRTLNAAICGDIEGTVREGRRLGYPRRSARDLFDVLVLA